MMSQFSDDVGEAFITCNEQRETIARLQQELLEAKAACAEMHNTLGFYANASFYSAVRSDGGIASSDISKDRGRYARIELLKPNPGADLLRELVELRNAVNIAHILIGMNVSVQDQGAWEKAVAAVQAARVRQHE